MAGEITLQQLMQTPTITRVVSRIKTPLDFFQRFFRMLPGQPASQNVSGRYLGWDIFDKTRLIAEGRAPGTGPSTVQRKAVGHVSTVAYRAHEKITLLHEEIFRTRPLGSQFGTVDLQGQNYINQQIGYLTQRFRNSREFMISRMFRGGFGVKVVGERYIPVESDDADAIFTVDFQIPAAHKTQLALGSGGANLIDAPWDDPGAAIVEQFLAVNQAMERLHGRALKHVFINSTTLGYLLNNTQLQAVGGSVYRIFDRFTHNQLDTDVTGPNTGFDVVFRALPLITFHVYDGGLNVDQLVDSDAIGNFSLFIPDGKAIMLPEPGNDWVGWINASEYVKENIMDGGRQVFGFHSWTTNVIDPAGVELKMLDNGLPALYIPKAVMYATVTGF